MASHSYRLATNQPTQEEITMPDNQLVAHNARLLYDALVPHPERYTVLLREDTPQWLKTACRAVHFVLPGEPLPSDWVYSAILNCAEFLVDNNGDIDEYEPDFHISVNSAELARWVADHAFARALVDEVMVEYAGALKSLDDVIMLAQADAYMRIIRSLYASLNDGEGLARAW